MSTSNEEKIFALKSQLLPTGRAWKLYFDGYMAGLFRALGISEAQAYEDSIAILDSLLPDNDRFTSDDATDWERRLGLITNLLTPLSDRKLAIRRKMQAPGIQPAHGHYLYLERMLQAAGFNVYVYENLYPTYPDGFAYMNPATLNAGILSQVEQGDFQQGDAQQGGYINALVANNIYNVNDITFDISGLQTTFFISAGPNTPGVYANVLASREAEFRQLILNIKQVQDVAILFINYI